jgi:hypothetical protein
VGNTAPTECGGLTPRGTGVTVPGVARWRRIAGPFESTERDLGWTWRVAREDAGTRDITVDVPGGRQHPRDLPADSVEAISTRGASAVDAFLDEDEPPPRILVLSLGVQARDLY